jgi:hypothetical protein
MHPNGDRMRPSIPLFLKKFLKPELLYLLILLFAVAVILPPVLSLLGVSHQQLDRMDAATEEQMKLFGEGKIFEFGFNQLLRFTKLLLFPMVFLLTMQYLVRRKKAKSKSKLEIFKEILDGFITGEFDEETFKNFYLEQTRTDEDILFKNELEILNSLFGNSSDSQTNSKPLLERVQELRIQLNTM